MHKSLIMVLAGACLAHLNISQASAAEQLQTTTLESFMADRAKLGKVLLHEDFSSLANGELPNGWNKDFAHPFLWNAAKSSGLHGDNVAVKDHKLHETVNGGSHILTLPPLHTSQYIMSVTFRFLQHSGSFGVVTDMADDFKQSTYAVNNMMYPYPEEDGELAQFVRATGDIGRVNVHAGNGYFKDKLPELNTDIVFTVCHLNNMTTFFCNGKFVSNMADYGLAVANQAHKEQKRTRVGLYALGGHVTVSTVTITELVPKTLFERGLIEPLTVGTCQICLADNPETNDVRGIRIPITLDKVATPLKPLFQLPFAINRPDIQIGALVLKLTDSLPEIPLTPSFPDVINLTARKVSSQEVSRVTVDAFLTSLSQEDLSHAFLIRPYVCITAPDATRMFYATTQKCCSPTVIANQRYHHMNQQEKNSLNSMFAGVKGYQGAKKHKLTFCMFSDFHYKKGMYAGRICDLQAILDRAHDHQVDAVFHGGDFCNDYVRSKELTHCLLDNTYKLPVYGIYGNHELETRGNTMQKVTPLITNNADAVVWGTPDGKIGDGSIAYYYVDINGFRLICTDTNYAWDAKQHAWIHNLEGSWGSPAGTSRGNSLGAQQLAWLERIIMEAAMSSIPCIVMGHDSFSGIWSSSPDTKAVQDIYRKANTVRPGTVLMSINGHYHKSKVQVKDNIFYWNVNTTFNGHWQDAQTEHHYTDQMTCSVDDFDENGTYIGTRTRRLNELSQAKNTWFFSTPMSAIATIDSTGIVTLEGGETTWRYGVVPINAADYERNLFIPSGRFNLME